MAIGKNGVFSEKTLSETLLCHYDPAFYVEPDGSAWIRVAHHGNPAAAKFASNDPFASTVYKDDNRWFDVSLCNYLSGIWEIMIKQKSTPTATEAKFRWTQKTNPMGGTYEDVAPSSANIVRNSDGYTLVSTYGGMYKLNNSSYLVATNGSKGNWFCAIGCWSAWNNGIPGFNGVAITTGYLDMYIRVDGFTNARASISKAGLYCREIIEM